ncbi:DUF1294 domain-containing protein [Gilvimarinus sp. 2_MG-2023]|uniref:DUF1294 domain-containing protein n=1 Tax=Gilvimarinus sp. 2_MG-2023 TaxID=3062666 RepID=UPI0034A5385D
MLALLGGWPGALYAQSRLRHKTIKQPFKTLLWLSILCNIGVLIWTFTPDGTLLVKKIENILTRFI